MRYATFVAILCLLPLASLAQVLDDDEVCVTVPEMDGELMQVVGVSLHVVGPDFELDQEILTGLVSAGGNSASNITGSSVQMRNIYVVPVGHGKSDAIRIRNAAVTVNGNDLIIWRYEGGKRVEVARFKDVYGERSWQYYWEEDE